ncbi:hypothetical protein ACLOJK_017757 [Asimina triloba]
MCTRDHFSWDFVTILAAVDAAPARSKRMCLIKIRSGVYKENVVVGVNKTNIALVGDGINEMIVTSDRFAANELGRFKTQFYRDCELHGSVDIIRGAAYAVFQNCKIYARLPSSTGQNITITSQE